MPVRPQLVALSVREAAKRLPSVQEEVPSAVVALAEVPEESEETAETADSADAEELAEDCSSARPRDAEEELARPSSDVLPEPLDLRLPLLADLPLPLLVPPLPLPSADVARPFVPALTVFVEA